MRARGTGIPRSRGPGTSRGRRPRRRRRTGPASAARGASRAASRQHLWPRAHRGAGSEPGERVGGQAAHGIMGEEGLVARVARRRRRHDFYGGEISEAPPNLSRDGRGRHDLGADAPDGRWVTDAAGSRISAGRACLSPIAGRPGGMPPGWCQEGARPRRCEARGPHRPPRDRALLRVRSGRGCDRRARGNARGGTGTPGPGATPVTRARRGTGEVWGRRHGRGPDGRQGTPRTTTRTRGPGSGRTSGRGDRQVACVGPRRRAALAWGRSREATRAPGRRSARAWGPGRR